jgi:CRISPR-associated endonuclease Csn1
MKKILGLDIGTNSIGWALILEPQAITESYQIGGMGVRIIPLSPDENDEFTKGNAISKNAKRTQKRGARRNLQRYKLRRQILRNILQALGMIPGKDLFEIDALTLYGLRAKAVNQQISLPEIGRILFHLNQKRGYKSNRKANNDEENIKEEPGAESDGKVKKKGYLDLIEDRERSLKEDGLTIGEHFHQMLLNDRFYRIKENIYLRSSYIDEFDRIWEKQQIYYPEILTEAIRQRIRNEIIYYQRPLRSQKGLVSDCLFEKHHKAAPKSSPLFQVSKIWQELNNIELTSFKALRNKEEGFKQGKRLLTLDEKQKLFGLLNIKGKLSVKECLKELGYQFGFDEYKLNIRNEKELEGNRTYAAIKKVFDQCKANYDHLLQFDLAIVEKEKVDKKTGEITIVSKIDPDFENQPLFQLWHLLYSAEETEPLITALRSRYGFSEELAKALSKIDFAKQGYGSLSAKALRNVLLHLQKGEYYSDACRLAGYNHSASFTKGENESRELANRLDLYAKNSLRQPVVEKIINQVINLVNEIIDEGNGLVTDADRQVGTFEIRVELARELRQSAEERNKAYLRNSKQDRRHKEIAEILKNELNFKRVSKNDIERYKLWEEFGCMSPYEPSKPISLTELFNQVPGNFYDIEHIIPKARLFDDSFTNKTICPRNLNSGSLGKNKMTAYDYMQSKGDQALHDYIEFIRMHLNKKDGISKGKFNKLMMSVEKIPDDFINRQLQETRFISREIKKTLSKICRSVHSSSGTVTSKLRHLWGWDDILMKLQIEKYRAAGITEWVESDRNGQICRAERIVGWTKREDHRHHAIDALTVACTKQGFIQRINHLNAQHNRDEMYQIIKDRFDNQKFTLLEKYLVSQKPFETSLVNDAASNILISFKSGKKVSSKSVNKIKKGKNTIDKTATIIPRGFLHKETVQGQIKQRETAKLSTRFDNVSEMVNNTQKAQVLSHLQKYDNNPKKAFDSKGLNAFIEQCGYSDVFIYKKEAVVRYKLDGNFKEKDIDSIVDKGVREIVRNHLVKFNNNPKLAFGSENIVWLNREKNVPVKSVRCKTGADSMRPLHKNEQGLPIDFVSTRNNHHIAIYRDREGKLKENAITFWEAFERKKAGLPTIITDPKQVWDSILSSGFDEQNILENLPLENWEYVTSLQQNEMFVLDLTKEEFNDALNENNLSLISKHLYRVQKIAASDYYFRHHLETSVEDKFNGVKNEALSITIGKVQRIRSLQKMTGIKVKVNNIGRIIKTGG